jgi:uridine phosphorylase
MPAKVVEPSIFSPEDYHSYLAERRNLPPERLVVPSNLICVYDGGIFEAVRKRIHGRYVRWYYEYYERLAAGTLHGFPFAVMHTFIGSAAAAMMLEEMIVSGARKVIEVGLCGGLVPSLRVGEIVVANRALVDEGTSSHYYHGAEAFDASERLTRRVELTLKKEKTDYKTGTVWTTDAPYRETRTKFRRFSEKGAVGVNMETSALFAVAKFRHIDIASLQVVSDLVLESEWKPSFHEKSVAKQSELASNIALRALEH